MQTYSKDNWQQIPRKVLSCVHEVLRDASAKLGVDVDKLDYKVIMTKNGPQINVKETK